ncbi:uncharacterized protein LOC141686396 [Apium graveolens]|uniref:uncharacterized protein LOC141686396 n=1 Tax=Apium graveolens TaxID=4045 RepID=UPI003D79CE49
MSVASNQSELTGNNLAIEPANTEGVSSNLSYNRGDETCKDSVGDYIDFAEQISVDLMEMPLEETKDKYVLKICRDEEVNNNCIEELSMLQIYRDIETLQMVLSLYAIKNNFQYKVKKSCTNEYFVKCVDQNCKWLLRASRNGKTGQFIIRKLFNNHTCDLEIRFKNQRQAITSVIANVIKYKFSNIKIRYSVADIIRDMKHDRNVEVKYNKSWRSKERALEITRGNATESFTELYSYMYMLFTSNGGSVIELQLTENSCFFYVFVALNFSMKGWKYCTPIVVVNGTFLKSAYGVDSENDKPCEWFFGKFRKAYGSREDMIIVPDRHESIIKGANKVYPEVPNVFCVFHLLGNIKSKFKKNLKKIKDAFLSAVNAYTLKKFEYHMQELQKVDGRVHDFLEEVGYEKWSKVYSPNNRYSNMTSNLAESLNSVPMSIRELPICTMLESLRALLQKWSWRNRNEAIATSTKLTKKYEEILKKNYLCSLDLTVYPTTHILFEVIKGERKNVVDLNARTCTCKRFQMDQIPCAHAIAVFQKCNMDTYNYYSPYYKKENMVDAYKETVYPVGNKDNWVVPDNVSSLIIYPPKGKIRVGR